MSDKKKRFLFILCEIDSKISDMKIVCARRYIFQFNSSANMNLILIATPRSSENKKKSLPSLLFVW